MLVNTRPGVPICAAYVPIRGTAFVKQAVGLSYDAFLFVPCYFRLRTTFREHTCRLFQHYPRLRGALLYLGADGWPSRVSVPFTALRRISEMGYSSVGVLDSTH